MAEKYGRLFMAAAAAGFMFASDLQAGGAADPAAVWQLYSYSGVNHELPGAGAPVPAGVPEGGMTIVRAPAGGYNALVWDPADKGDWYEWWYYKVVVPGTGDAFYFCYGVVNPWDVNQTNPASRSYVSAGSFGDKEVVEQTFRPGDFSASSEATFIEIGGNAATDRALKGRLPAQGGGEFAWDLKLEKDWGVNLMGWAMHQDWISNIYWYPAQAGAWMSGKISYRGREVLLDRAPAYQDRNWGRSFPKWWTWLVSNSFKNSPGTILAAGGGQPKIFPGVSLIQAVTIGLRHQGREYLFQPTAGDPVSVDVNFGKWEVSARNKRGERVKISAYAPREKFLLLRFMTPQGKTYNDYEALAGHIAVKLYKDSKLIADLETDDGGIEYGSFASFGPGAGASAAEAPGFEALFSGENHLQ